MCDDISRFYNISYKNLIREKYLIIIKLYLIKKRVPDLIILTITLTITGLIAYGYLVWGIYLLPILFFYTMYTIGKRRPINRVDAERIEDEKIKEMVEELSGEIGIDEPVIMEGKLGSLNAFAVGRKGAGTVVLSHHLPDVLDDDELRAVLLHEMSHLKSHDTIITTFNNTIGYVLEYIGFQFKDSIVLYPLHLLFSKVLYTLVELPFLYISRKRELLADRDSARINGRVPMIKALDKIARVNKDIDKDNMDKTTKQICISDVRKKARGKVKGAFSTHPRMETRIENIKNTKPEE